MPRRPRVFVEGGTYHVSCRVTRAERVFATDEYARLFVSMLQEIKARDGFTLFAWALMSNHYHLLVRTLDVPLWRTMASLQGGFTRQFNRRHNLVGPFWQGRYNAKLVKDQSYFDQLLAYIHLNPVTAGLVDDPATHRYSGHREILGEAGFDLVDSDDVLARFANRTEEGRRAYLTAIQARSKERWLTKEPGELPWWRRAAADDAATDVTPRTGRPSIDELGRSTGIERPPLVIDELIDHVCARCEIDVGTVSGRGQSQDTVRVREALALLAVERYGLKAKDLASALGKGPDTVSRWLSRAARRRRADHHFAESLETLDRSLSGLPPAGRTGPGADARAGSSRQETAFTWEL